MRTLSVVVWLLLALFAALSAVGGPVFLLRSLPSLLLAAALAYALFWRPCVRVDDDSVTLVNVLRDVHVPFSSLDAVGTRFALTLQAGDRSYTAWAAPAPGRTSTMGLARRDAVGVQHLGVDLDQGLRSSTAPNSDSGGAALLVEHRWQQWRFQHRGEPAQAGVQVRWAVPLAVLLAASLAGTGMVWLVP